VNRNRRRKASAAACHLCCGFQGDDPRKELQGVIERGVRSVILFARNVGTPEQTRALCRAIKSLSDEPIMICIDQEGGSVQRLREGFTSFPSMRAIAQSPDPISLAASTGAGLARELRAVGIDVNLAPVLDVDSNPANPVIGERSFSADPSRVAQLGVMLASAMQAGGVGACGKHFPGHGDTDLDSHFDLPSLKHDQTRLTEVELVPFRAAARAGLAMMMTAHVMFPALDPQRPATLSAAVINDLLRGRLGFEGVVITDDLEMKAILDRWPPADAALAAILAGADMPLCCHTPDHQHAILDALDTAVTSGFVSDERLASSRRRLDHLFAQFVRPVV